MNQDARERAQEFFEEVRFNKGEVYQEMREGLERVFNPRRQKVSPQLLKRATEKNGTVDEEYLVRAVKLNTREADVIFKTMANGLLATLGVRENHRPDVEIVYDPEDLPLREDGSCPRGRFYRPTSSRRRELNTENARQNGKIMVYTPVFDEFEFLPDMLETLAHECFHAYQLNSARGAREARTDSEQASQEIYLRDYQDTRYAKSNESFAKYYVQGRESSAREFGEWTYRAMISVVADAALEREY